MAGLAAMVLPGPRNANGVGPPNPGLAVRGGLAMSAYPGTAQKWISNPDGVEAVPYLLNAATPLGLGCFLNKAPKVVAPLQPWAECWNAVGVLGAAGLRQSRAPTAVRKDGQQHSGVQAVSQRGMAEME